MSNVQKITPFLWFNGAAESAAKFYISIFANSRIVTTSRYDESSAKASGQPEGSVMIVEFELDGQKFTAINGGPHFQMSGAVSFVIDCETQQEVDHFWNHLAEGGPVEAQQCGWVRDRFGVTWQVVPTVLPKLLGDPDPAKAQRTMQAMLTMKKFDIAGLQRAHDGG